ncbi:hypothetical protein GCM10020358_41060 [Amorphoplanes nipponensis]|uniref:LexA family protein n=1 Tax=Actinoplanes nipponensis TaxID=135950 RepID=UPI00338D2F54
MFLEPASRAEGDPATVGVPLLGAVAAGSPILAEETLDETLTLPRELVGRGELFGLRVRGDSMTGAAICDGDVVVIRRQPEAWNGDIVCALIDDEATVKVFRRPRRPRRARAAQPGVRRHRRRPGGGAGQGGLGAAPGLSRSLDRAAAVTPYRAGAAPDEIATVPCNRDTGPLAVSDVAGASAWRATSTYSSCRQDLDGGVRQLALPLPSPRGVATAFLVAVLALTAVATADPRTPAAAAGPPRRASDHDEPVAAPLRYGRVEATGSSPRRL